MSKSVHTERVKSLWPILSKQMITTPWEMITTHMILQGRRECTRMFVNHRILGELSWSKLFLPGNVNDQLALTWWCRASDSWRFLQKQIHEVLAKAVRSTWVSFSPSCYLTKESFFLFFHLMNDGMVCVVTNPTFVQHMVCLSVLWRFSHFPTAL